MASASFKKVIFAALIGNFLIALAEFIAFFVTRCSAMLSEGVHSAVDNGWRRGFRLQRHLLNLSVDFSDNLSTANFEDAISMLDRQIRLAYPKIKRVFVEAEPMRTNPAAGQTGEVVSGKK